MENSNFNNTLSNKNIEESITKRMGHQSRILAEQKFDVNNINREMVKIIKK